MTHAAKIKMPPRMLFEGPDFAEFCVQLVEAGLVEQDELEQEIALWSNASYAISTDADTVV